MYLNHFGLDRKPFDISPDPSFLWMSEKHKEALAHLKYGIIDDKGFLVLTGDVGTGKTALIQYLIQSIDLATIVVTIPDPDMGKLDFFNFMASELRMGQTFTSKGEFLIEFKKFLLKAFADYRKVVLIIDEAQRLNNELLDEIRLLGNIDFSGLMLLNIFFVGQNEFAAILMQEANRSTRQRITANYQISPLSAEEVEEYVRHRLLVAGAVRQIFKLDAIQKVYQYSRGYPRLINIICDRALMTGYSSGQTAITAGMVDECARELEVALGDVAVPAAPDNAVDLMPEKNFRTQKAANLKIAVGSRVLETEADFGNISAGKKTPVYHDLDFIKRELALQKRDQHRRMFAIAAGIVFMIGLLGGVGYLLRNGVATSPHTMAAGNAAAVYKEGLRQVPAARKIIDMVAPAKRSSVIGELSGAEPTTGENEPSANLGSESPLHEPLPLEDQKFIVFFKHNSNRLPQETIDTLNRIIDVVADHPITTIRVTGYTDSYGDRLYNVMLSAERANRVKAYLVQGGVPASKIQVHGLGPENPIESNATLEGRRKNRRVEIELGQEDREEDQSLAA
ncbi:MAG: OmpA family protein [Deltaproteobacteria bacterium]|jgi:general secretion pathway protein A|nr:OmpA family protein [Deltaproteobacteria bacterium]